VRGVLRTQAYPAASLNRRFDLLPVDALVYLVVGCRLRCQSPIRLNWHLLAHLRITVVPQRRPACLLTSAPSVMKAMSRIWPPHIGHSSGNLNQLRTELVRCA
jgi:hypothetical protein